MPGREWTEVHEDEGIAIIPDRMGARGSVDDAAEDAFVARRGHRAGIDLRGQPLAATFLTNQAIPAEAVFPQSTKDRRVNPPRSA